MVKLEWRTITKERQKKLIGSIDKFNLVETPVINTDNRIIAGERRCYSSELDEVNCDKSIRRYIRFMKQYGQPLTIMRNGKAVNPDLFFQQ